ncbi:MAG TPA: hypothetical protein VMZ53_22770 [Kofleriaceae bacterium]|nr:hypothetical protein [Kofleriaceae bacterium]
MEPPADGQLRIRITPTLFIGPARFIIRPRISIDGVVEKTRWGTQIRTLPAGPHRLVVWFPWLLVPEAGRAELTVELVPGTVTSVRYHTTSFAIAGGRMTLDQSEIAGPATP